MNLRLLLCIPLLLMATGCMTETRSFDIAVKNATAGPLTMWTIKQTGPPEMNWFSPEQIAVLANPPPDDRLPCQVIPPGKTAVNQMPITGEFDKERGRAFIRIYKGEPTLNEMLAMNPRSRNQLEQRIEPGFNSFIISDESGFITATRGPVPPPKNEPK